MTESPCEGQVGTSVSITAEFKCASGGLPSFTWDGDPIGTGYQLTISAPSDDVPGAYAIKAGCNGGIHLLDLADSVNFTVEPPTIRASPSSGVVGSSFEISGQGWPTNCSPITYAFDGTDVAGSTVTVPASTTVGDRSVTAQCTSSAGQFSDTVVQASTTFTVLPSRTVASTTTSAPTTVTTTTSSTSAGTSTSRSSSTTTTTTGRTTPTTTPSGTTASTTTSAAPTTSVTTSASPTGTPTTSSSATSSAGQAPPRTLTLSTLSVSPGESVNATGHGCAAGSDVTLSLGGVAVGQTTADASGDYRAPLSLGSVAVGRYTVTALCGTVTAAAPLDVVLVSQVSADTSTLAIIVFVVLLGALLYRRRLLPRPRAVAAPSDTDQEQP